MHSLDLGHYSRFAMEIEGYKSQVSSYYLSPAISPCPSDEVYSVVFAVSTGAPVERLRGCSTHEPNFWVHVPFLSVPDYLLKGKGLAGRVWV